MTSDCALYDRQCIECGECCVCDINPDKRCNNCEECIDEKDIYRSISVDKFLEKYKD